MESRRKFCSNGPLTDVRKQIKTTTLADDSRVCVRERGGI